MTTKIIGVHVHDSYQAEFCSIPNIEMYHLTNKDKKQKLWGGGSRLKPSNLYEVPYENLEDIDWSKYDLLITQSIEQYEQFKHLPIKSLIVEHTLPYPLYQGSPHQHFLETNPNLKKIVFLSEEQVYAWRMKNPLEVEVIPSCIDVSLYEQWTPNPDSYIFNATNSIFERTWCYGGDIWNWCTIGLPRILAGEGNNSQPNNIIPAFKCPKEILDLNINAGG